jgi:hypothetical protein
MPVSRNRRLLVAVVAVCLIGAGRWLSRPRVDPRIIGTWREDHEDLGRARFRRFRLDGTGDYWETHLDGTSILAPQRFVWSFAADVRVIDMSAPGLDGLKGLFEQYSWQPQPAFRQRFELIEAKRDSLRVFYPPFDADQMWQKKWHRVTE